MESRDERILRANGAAELLDDPRFAPYCRLVSGRLAIREAHAQETLDATSAPTYHLIAMILIRTAGNFLESWRASGHALNQKAYNEASRLYNRAAFAMRQASLAELYRKHKTK